jgi:hypothetical protein
MPMRAILAGLLLTVYGSIALTGIVPWFNPCIGASRFVECVDPQRMTEVQMQNGGTLTCNLGVCDYFPSIWERLVQLLTCLLLVAGAGALAALTVRERRALIGLSTSAATVVSAIALTTLVYPYGAT